MKLLSGRSGSMRVYVKDDNFDDIMFKYFNHKIWGNRDSNYVPNFPLDVQIELINKCNLSCESCPINESTRKLSLLSWDILKKIVDESAFEEVAYFTICGIGEASLHPDLFKLTQYVRDQVVEVKGLRQYNFIPTVLISNGIWNEKTTKECLFNPPDLVSFSLAGLTKEDILKRRGKIDIDKLKQTINYLYTNRFIVRKVDGVKLPVIHISTHILPSEFKERASDIDLFLQEWFPFCDVVVLKPTMLSSYYRQYQEFLSLSKYKNISNNHYKRTLPCFECHRRLSINSDGDVWCGHHNSEDFGSKLGNVYKQSLKDIWNSVLIKQFRNEVGIGIFNRPNCIMCGGEIRE